MNILKLKRELTLTIVILLIIPFTTLAQDSLTLRLKLKTGQSFDFVVGTNMQMEMNMGDTSMKMDMTMQQGMKYEVFSVKDNGDMEIGTTPNSSKMQMEMMDGMTFEYDSNNPNLEDPTTQSMHDAFSKTIGKTIKMTMTPIGKISDYSGFEEYFDDLLEDNPGSESVKEMFGDESMKELMGQFTGLYPEEAVSIGDSWEVTLNWKQMGMDIVYDYTLLEINDGKAKIGIKGKMDFDLGEAMANMTQMTEEMGFEYEMTGSIDGSFELDATDGWIDNMVQNMVVSGFMKMKMPKGASLEDRGISNATLDENGKVVIPMSIKMAQTMKRQ